MTGEQPAVDWDRRGRHRTPGRFGAALRRGLAVAGLAAAAVIGYAHFVEPRRLRIERWTVRVPGLPASWEGLRVVHLTDFQEGMWLQDRTLSRRAIEVAVSLRPDVVMLTGDFVHRGRRRGDDQPYRTLTRAAPTYAVLGNHDHHNGEEGTARMVEELRKQGVEVLNNSHAWFRHRGESWAVVGVDDLATGHTDLLAAITGIPRDTRLLALLTHVPDVADLAPEGWFALILAGHTHGAQLHLSPGGRLGWLRLGGARRAKYLRGWYDTRSGPLYVNRGLGLSNLPLRLGAPPEVALFVLTNGDALPFGVRRLRLRSRMPTASLG